MPTGLASKLFVFVFNPIICVWFLAREAQAQYSNSSFLADSLSSVRLIARIGANVAGLSGDNLAQLSRGGNADWLLGFRCGISAATFFSRKWGFIHHLEYLQQGARLWLLDNQERAYRSVFRLHTLQLAPLNLYYQHKKAQLSLGPYFSVLAAARIQRKTASGELFEDASIFGAPESPSRYAQKVDFGIVLRLAYSLKNNIELGVALQRGFLPVIENAGSISGAGQPPEPQTQIFNQVFSFSIGYCLLK